MVRFYNSSRKNNSIRKQGAFAFRVTEEGFGLCKAALDAARPGEFNLFGIPFAGLLGEVRETSGAAALFHSGNVDVIGRREHRSVLGDLVIIKRKLIFGGEPCIKRKHRNSPMVTVMVDGPLSQNHIGFFRSEQPAESLIVRVIDNGAAIILAGESCSSPQALASLLSFASADRGTAIQTRATAEPLATV